VGRAPKPEDLKALDRDIAQGHANLARLPQDVLAGVVAQVRAWQRQRDALEARRSELATGTLKDKAVLDEARKQLWRLRESLASGDEELQATVLSEVVSKVEIRFAHEETHGKRSPTGTKRTLSRTERLVLYVRPGLGLSCLDIPGWQSPARAGASGRASNYRSSSQATG